ncbi:hypothetical protein L226DRAFT_108349 [Lentinus tigrinus ALCF2SS1-7]|uniref:Uncharacterized protein n=1 Tax=Lentinus tigrinus ALCF2SS1-6 TaxID=1328759 RepID=A0A5C2S7C3_9APHY|nr:hypothetical protein L227DRAFT_170919 [Lentinus tigrinus ALCF2SS1-6]RPD73343.1 hypothetical protein L226DRAFT_108349 [Lentinus tigrinus ALCF2SS1-7]
MIHACGGRASADSVMQLRALSDTLVVVVVLGLQCLISHTYYILMEESGFGFSVIGCAGFGVQVQLVLLVWFGLVEIYRIISWIRHPIHVDVWAVWYHSKALTRCHRLPCQIMASLAGNSTFLRCCATRLYPDICYGAAPACP